jgi:hypothetical protein
MALVYVHKNLSVKVKEFLKNECIAHKYSGSPVSEIEILQKILTAVNEAVFYHGVNIV